MHRRMLIVEIPTLAISSASVFFNFFKAFFQR